MSEPRELSVTTHIDASPETVWQVMTGRMAEWWCPKPWTVTLDEIDLVAERVVPPDLHLHGLGRAAAVLALIHLVVAEGDRRLLKIVNRKGRKESAMGAVKGEEGGSRYSRSSQLPPCPPPRPPPWRRRALCPCPKSTPAGPRPC